MQQHLRAPGGRPPAADVGRALAPPRRSGPLAYLWSWPMAAKRYLWRNLAARRGSPPPKAAGGKINKITNFRAGMGDCDEKQEEKDHCRTRFYSGGQRNRLRGQEVSIFPRHWRLDVERPASSSTRIYRNERGCTGHCSCNSGRGSNCTDSPVSENCPSAYLHIEGRRFGSGSQRPRPNIRQQGAKLAECFSFSSGKKQSI